jgi:hypothetical protein
MRRWLLLLMIMLLPVRGWVGDAMAGQMLQQRTHAAMAAGAKPAHHAPQRAAHDCDEHRSAAVGTTSDVAADVGLAAAAAKPSADAGGDCPTCASCQVCSSVALSPSVPLSPGPGFSQAAPHTDAPSLASAEQAIAFKPPRG